MRLYRNVERYSLSVVLLSLCAAAWAGFEPARTACVIGWTVVALSALAEAVLRGDQAAARALADKVRDA